MDACHRQGIGVILDFVPVHFAVDAYGLRRYDGTALYEYPSNDVGESEWGSCNFMHSRGEIRSFLQSCAAYWLEQYHFDGLRMDAVSRLLYWQGDPARGVNGTTVEFLKNMNAGLQERFPTAMLIAEDSTNYPKVTAPVGYGGLGFDYKWDLGWMNDTLDYFKKPPLERKYHFGKLSFSMMYFYNEHYILPFSHDENVHGKATILQKMYGDYDVKFPQGRALYLYMMAHPGKKLDFMGNEIGQLREYDESRQQDWDIRRYPNHDAFGRYRTELGQLYRELDAFWCGEFNAAHFRWLDCNTGDNCACALLRKGRDTAVVAMFNFDCVTLENYVVPLPGSGTLTLLMDTDWQCWGGAAPRPGTPRAEPCAGKFTTGLAAYSGRLYLWRQEQTVRTGEPAGQVEPQ
ncbi:MAG: alpha amylase C-terminal domain-containing protein [Gemmiger sp.]